MGRARGRSRRGGRTDAPPPGAEARRPEEISSRPPDAAPVVRGRVRGPPTDSAPTPTAQTAPPTEALQKMDVSEREPSQARGERKGGRFSEPVTRPAGLDKKGSAGTVIALSSNCFLLETRADFVIYQYNFSFSPEVDSKKVKFGLMFSQEELIGKVRAFDGMSMFLPRKLPDPVSKIPMIRGRRDNPDGEAVEIVITLTNELPQDQFSNKEV